MKILRAILAFFATLERALCAAQLGMDGMDARAREMSAASDEAPPPI